MENHKFDALRDAIDGWLTTLALEIPGLDEPPLPHADRVFRRILFEASSCAGVVRTYGRYRVLECLSEGVAELKNLREEQEKSFNEAKEKAELAGAKEVELEVMARANTAELKGYRLRAQDIKALIDDAEREECLIEKGPGAPSKDTTVRDLSLILSSLDYLDQGLTPAEAERKVINDYRNVKGCGRTTIQKAMARYRSSNVLLSSSNFDLLTPQEQFAVIIAVGRRRNQTGLEKLRARRHRQRANLIKIANQDASLQKLLRRIRRDD